MRSPLAFVLPSIVLAALACGCERTPPQAAASEAKGSPASTASEAATAAAAHASAPTAIASGAPKPPAGPPADGNVVLISIDSLRADMPWAGYGRDIAPRLTEIEKKAVSYTRGYSVSSYTSMSLGGLLGAKIPSELKRDGWFFGSYDESQTFFPELVQKAGIHTMAVQAHFYFQLNPANKEGAGFEQGFDEWQVVAGIHKDNLTDHDITSPKTYELAEKLLGDQANASRRFFFWTHFMDPHDEYLPHDGIGPYGKTARDKYDAEVTFTDSYVGKLVDFIQSQPWASKTSIIITADHGEAFGEHDRTRHGFEIWEPLVRVPMMLLLPGAPARRIDTPRSGLDVSQTILDLLGVQPDPSYEGTSMVKEAYGAEAAPHDVYVDLPMTSNNPKRRALVRGTNKLICFDTDNICKLYDLAADPTEDHPIATGDTYKEMFAAYQAHVKELHEQAPTRCGADCLNGAYMNRKH